MHEQFSSALLHVQVNRVESLQELLPAASGNALSFQRFAPLGQDPLVPASVQYAPGSDLPLQ